MIYILLIENNLFFFLSVGDMKKKMYLSMTFLISLTISNILLLNNKEKPIAADEILLEN